MPDSQLVLIRHGAVDGAGHVLWGRTDVPLSAAGRMAIARLAGELAALRIARILASPRRRAVESAAILRERLGASVEVECGFDEFDFGEWTGRSFETLQRDPRFRRFNDHRAESAAPGGETMRQFCERVRRTTDACLASAHSRVCVVTHAEVIRTLVIEARGLSLDAWPRVPIESASATILQGRSRPLRVASLPAAGDLRCRAST